jgi:hypothetical protein
LAETGNAPVLSVRQWFAEFAAEIAEFAEFAEFG